MDNKFKALQWDEVVSIQDNRKILIPHLTFKVSEFAKAVINLVKNSDSIAQATIQKIKISSPLEEWISEGVECQVLKYGAQGWQTGTVRITLEFCPDEPEVEDNPINEEPETSQAESPLDDLRQRINQNNL